MRAGAKIGRFLLPRPVGRQPVPVLPEVSPARALRSPGARTSALVGIATAFVVAVDLARGIGPRLLLDPDRSWAFARVALGLIVLAAASGAGVLAAVAFGAFLRSHLATRELEPLPFSRRALWVLAGAALLIGIAARAAWIGTLPFPFLEDEVNLITPALGLSGAPRDFADAILPIPLGRPDPHEMIGVAYLELLRASLGTFGTTVAAVRFPSLLGGVLSLVTAGLLGRALLPGGGGMAAVLILAGLRWHAILSVSGWHAILIAPIVDRRRCSVWARGVAAPREPPRRRRRDGGPVRTCTSSWAAAAALSLRGPAAGGVDARRLLALVAGSALTVRRCSVREGRRVPYFGDPRATISCRDSRYQKSRSRVFALCRRCRHRGSSWPQAPTTTDRPAGWIVGGYSRSDWRALSGPATNYRLCCCTPERLEPRGVSGTAGHPNVRFGYAHSDRPAPPRACSLYWRSPRPRAAAMVPGLSPSAALRPPRCFLIGLDGVRPSTIFRRGHGHRTSRGAVGWLRRSRSSRARTVGPRQPGRALRADPETPARPAPEAAGALHRRSARRRAPASSSACATRGREWAVCSRDGSARSDSAGTRMVSRGRPLRVEGRRHDRDQPVGVPDPHVRNGGRQECGARSRPLEGVKR